MTNLLEFHGKSYKITENLVEPLVDEIHATFCRPCITAKKQKSFILFLIHSQTFVDYCCLEIIENSPSRKIIYREKEIKKISSSKNKIPIFIFCITDYFLVFWFH